MKKKYKINWKIRFKMAINTYLSIITLYVNGQNVPIEIHGVTDWIIKQEPTICCLQETHFRAKDTHRLKVRGWKKIFHANRNDKKVGVAILISEKIDFKIKDKEGHYIMIKGSIQEETIILINIYAPNIGAPKYIKQILTDIKGEIDRNTIIVGVFNTPQTSMDRSSRQKINKATEVLNDAIEQLDLIDIFRTLHLKKKQNTHSFQVYMEHSLE